MMILYIISCSIFTIAQSDFYYYKGNKIPLTLNGNKVCVSIPKDCDNNTLECANTLWGTGKFTASTPDLSANHLILPNDPMFYQQWGLYNSNYPGIDISAISAWNYATGKHVKIAIYDKGVDTTQVDIRSNISNLSYNAGTGSSPSFVYGVHGTLCAGIAAAIKDNEKQIVGVAPEATIISISNTFNSSYYDPIKIADGINWAYQHGADIISNSWYCPNQNERIDEAIFNAFRYGRQGKGCIIVFAAGNKEEYENSYDIKYPANSNDTILVVGAINRAGTRASYSTYGAKLDLVAPGDSIYSTFPNDSVGYESGTSMACPHVAGVAALILEINPELTVNQVNSIICSTAKKLSGVDFNVQKTDGMWNNQYGYGLVNAYGSVLNTPTLVYIQNETISGTRYISADSIYVGRDVTDRKEYGDVILGPGNITLDAGYVEIKNSTTVPLGTTLTIEN